MAVNQIPKFNEKKRIGKSKNVYHTYECKAVVESLRDGSDLKRASPEFIEYHEVDQCQMCAKIEAGEDQNEVWRRHTFTKIDESDCKRIRKLSKNMSNAEIANRFSICKETVINHRLGHCSHEL